jgi:hypothetical protein
VSANELAKMVTELEELEAKSCAGDINSAECGYARQEFRAALMEAWPDLLEAAKRVAELTEALRPFAERMEAFAEARHDSFDFSNNWPIDVDLGDLRAARAALAKGGAA